MIQISQLTRLALRDEEKVKPGSHSSQTVSDNQRSFLHDYLDKKYIDICGIIPISITDKRHRLRIAKRTKLDGSMHVGALILDREENHSIWRKTLEAKERSTSRTFSRATPQQIWFRFFLR